MNLKEYNKIRSEIQRLSKQYAKEKHKLKFDSSKEKDVEQLKEKICTYSLILKQMDSQKPGQHQ